MMYAKIPMPSYMSIEDAAKELKIDTSNFHGTKNRYEKYINRSDPRKLKFDMNKYKYYKGLEDTTYSRVTMFIEYLVDLGYYTRTEIAEKTNLKVQTISSHQFGFDIARKIGDWFMENEPYLVDEFDSYYGWNQVAIKRKRNVAKRI